MSDTEELSSQSEYQILLVRILYVILHRDIQFGNTRSPLALLLCLFDPCQMIEMWKKFLELV